MIFSLTGWAALSEVLSRSLLNISQGWSAWRAFSPIHRFLVVDPSDRVPQIINHILQFTASSWGRPGYIMSVCDWLAAVIVCEKREKKGKKIKRSVVMRFQPLPGTAHSCIFKFPLVSSDVPLSDATIVFVLDAVRALIVNWSNYSGPCPPSGNSACNGRSWCMCWSSHRDLQTSRERWWEHGKSKHANS